MVIGSHCKLSHIKNNFSVKVNNTPIDRVLEHKYLGVHLDESLKWHSHVKVITKKISAGLAVLKVSENANIIFIHSPQGFSGIIYNTG